LPSRLVHVVDDDASVRRSLTRLLSVNGFEVAAFASAQEFLASGSAPRGGCIVLDHQMPGMTGLELQQRLAAGPGHWEIVFMTGHAEIRQRLEDTSRGKVEFLSKPAKPADLIAAVERAVARFARRTRPEEDAGSSSDSRAIGRK
jgi:two-component system, LuxR family, response regulator FixJ